MDIYLFLDDLTLIVMSAVLTALSFQLFFPGIPRNTRFLWLVIGVFIGFFSEKFFGYTHLFMYIEDNPLMNRFLSLFKIALMIVGYVFILKELYRIKPQES